MGVGDRRYAETVPDDGEEKRDEATLTTGALGAIALAVVKAGRAEEVSGFLKRHMTGLDATTPGGEMALKVYVKAMDVIALHVKRLKPKGSGELKEGGGA